MDKSRVMASGVVLGCAALGTAIGFLGHNEVVKLQDKGLSERTIEVTVVQDGKTEVKTFTGKGRTQLCGPPRAHRVGFNWDERDIPDDVSRIDENFMDRNERGWMATSRSSVLDQPYGSRQVGPNTWLVFQGDRFPISYVLLLVGLLGGAIVGGYLALGVIRLPEFLYFVALKRRGDIGVLLSLLNDQNLERQRCAALILGELKDSRALLPLIDVLKREEDSSNKPVRAAVALALGEIGDPAAIEPLVVALGRVDCHSDEILQALVKLRASQAIPAIVTLLDSNRTVRAAGAALVEMGGSDAIGALLDYLCHHHGSLECAVNVAEALSEGKVVESLPTLHGFLMRIPTQVEEEVFVEQTTCGVIFETRRFPNPCYLKVQQSIERLEASLP